MLVAIHTLRYNITYFEMHAIFIVQNKFLAAKNMN